MSEGVVPSQQSDTCTRLFGRVCNPQDVFGAVPSTQSEAITDNASRILQEGFDPSS